jgi:hypothetical protein
VEFELQAISYTDREYISHGNSHMLLLPTKSLLYIVQASSSHNKYFDSFDAFNTASTIGDPIDEWLNTPPILNISNSLQYWTAMAASGHPLAPMATNFLSIPGKQKNLHIFVTITQYFVCSYIH